MRCPFCQSQDNRVVDSRLAREGRSIRRRRLCEACSERFTTYEVVEDAIVDVAKRDGQTEPFDAEKLLRSMRIACKKRPVPTEALVAFVDRLESRLASRPKRTATSQEVGEAVLGFLRGLDPVAYVRYASVYRSFHNIDEFLIEIATFEPRLEATADEARHEATLDCEGPAGPVRAVAGLPATLDDASERPLPEAPPGDA